VRRLGIGMVLTLTTAQSLGGQGRQQRRLHELGIVARTGRLTEAVARDGRVLPEVDLAPGRRYCGSLLATSGGGSSQKSRWCQIHERSLSLGGTGSIRLAARAQQWHLHQFGVVARTGADRVAVAGQCGVLTLLHPWIGDGWRLVVADQLVPHRQRRRRMTP